jgi:hypothetical protein
MKNQLPGSAGKLHSQSGLLKQGAGTLLGSKRTATMVKGILNLPEVPSKANRQQIAAMASPLLTQPNLTNLLASMQAGIGPKKTSHEQLSSSQVGKTPTRVSESNSNSVPQD